MTWATGYGLHRTRNELVRCKDVHVVDRLRGSHRPDADEEVEVVVAVVELGRLEILERVAAKHGRRDEDVAVGHHLGGILAEDVSALSLCRVGR